MSAEDYMFEHGDWGDWSYTYNRYHKRSRHYKQYDSFDYSLYNQPYSNAERRAYGHRKVRAFYREFLKALPISLKEKAFYMLFKHNLQYKKLAYMEDIPIQYEDAFRRMVFNLAGTEDLTNAWLNMNTYEYFRKFPRNLRESLLKDFVDNYNLDLSKLSHIKEYNIDA